MDQSVPAVYVIVLNYNGKRTLFDCLNTVFQSDYKNFEVVVVDNDSQDGSFEQARHDFARANFIKNSANIGFSKGNNIGIRYALEKFAEYIFVLNNDAIIEKTTISQLVAAARKNEKAGILCPLIFEANKEKVWFAGGKVIWKKMRNEHVFETQNEDPYLTEYVSGCAMFIKKDVFKEIGLFDERYFLYYEDADLSLRASKAGFDLLMCPQIHVTHLEQSSQSNEKIYWLVLSALLFFKTHSIFSQRIWHFFYLRARKIKNLFDVLFKKSEEARLVRKAYKDIKKISA